MMAGLGSLKVCLHFRELMEAEPDGLALVVLRPEDLVGANIARPVLSELRLRAVLLMSEAMYATARIRAPDLLDWASATIEAQPLVPGFVIESLRLVAQHFPGLAWKGSAEAAMAAIQGAFPGQAHREAPSPREYGALVDALASTRGWRVVPVAHEADGLRLRIALAESGRRGRVLAVGHPVLGWPTLDPAVASWDALDGAGLDGAQAVRIDCEAAALAVAEPDEAVRIDALSGQGPMSVVREVLQRADLKALRRTRDRIAGEALRAQHFEHIHHVAAWADRVAVPLGDDAPPRLAALALPGFVRVGGGSVAAASIARQMAWHDIGARWESRLSTKGDGLAVGEDQRPGFAKWLRRSGRLLADAGDYPHAEPMLRATVSLCMQLGDRELLADALYALGTLLAEVGHFVEAEEALQACRAIEEEVSGASGLRYGVALQALGSLFLQQGRYAEAEAQLKEALAVYDASVGREHVEWGTTMHELSTVLTRLGRYAEAETCARAAREIVEKAFGTTHPRYGAELFQLADVMLRLGRLDEAEVTLRQAWAVFEQALGEHHIHTAVALHALAHIAALRGRFDEADRLLQSALAIKETRLGRGHPEFASSLHELAGVRIHQGRYGEAEALLREALTIKEASLGKAHRDYGASLHQLGQVLAFQGRLQEAEGLLREALHLFEGALGMAHPDRGSTLHALAEVLFRQGRLEEAEALMREALRVKEETLGPNHLEFGATLHGLGGALARQGRFGEAEALFQAAVANAKTALGTADPNYATSLSMLGMVVGQRDPVEGAALLREALSIFEAARGAHDPTSQAMRKDLETLLRAGQDATRQPLALVDRAPTPTPPPPAGRAW